MKEKKKLKVKTDFLLRTFSFKIWDKMRGMGPLNGTLKLAEIGRRVWRDCTPISPNIDNVHINK